MNSLGPELIIEPNGRSVQYWQDLWRYRDLLFFLSWRDILVRYKQTVFGISWALLPSLMTLSVFTVVFGKLARFPSGGAPYPILVLAGILPWNLFSGALSQGGQSLVSNSQLISKIYFPRIIIPLSAVVVSLVDFLVSFCFLLVLMVWFHWMPPRAMVMLPLFVLLAMVAAFAAGIGLSALNVKYRDFRYLVPMIVQLGVYISPVGFSSGMVPARWRLLYSLNPMVGVIDGFRWAILGTSSPLYVPGLVLSLLLVTLVLIVGIRYFRQVEDTFADVI
jgi:lipopolysaccharide transport system permease protein